MKVYMVTYGYYQDFSGIFPTIEEAKAYVNNRDWNDYWKIEADIWECPVPGTYEDRKKVWRGIPGTYEDRKRVWVRPDKER